MMECYDLKFKRRMTGAERAILMVPLNVVMVAKIRGAVDVKQVAAELDRLRKRHALLAVRVVIEKNDVAWYVPEGVPEFRINTIHYGQYQLESVYGPFVYSDVNEKTIGVITVGDKATFIMSYNETIVNSRTAEQIRDTAMDYLLN